MLEVTVTERGETELDPAAWELLQHDESFWALVDRKLLTIRYSGRGDPKLGAHGFVGRALIGDVSISVVEKIPGALQALLGFATGSDFRIERQETTASELGPLVVLIVSQFVDLVRSYASRGREWRYERESRVGSLVGGRINISRTVSLHARGLRHVVAFDKNTVTYRTDLNRVIAAALAQVERIAKVIPIPDETLFAVRSLSTLFGDCMDATLILTDRLRLARMSDELRDNLGDDKHADLLALASLLLMHESFDRPSTQRRRLPRSWFLNLETLFESAVRRALRQRLKPNFSVTDGRRGAKPIFSTHEDEFTANPDIVIAGKSRAMVGDVKYKTWNGSASASDLNQLLVHAEAFGAREAFLVFPSAAFEARDLGVAATGCRTWLFSLDVRSIDAGLDQLSASLNLPLPASV